ncbi:MAG: hypothetical protein QG594_850 [Bacteroidota bacterium]|nr:hypothetical protein [Bacteroidota bacterium]
MNCLKKFLLYIIIGSFGTNSWAQNFSSFLKPADSLNSTRTKTIIIASSIATATALAGLNQLWYANYPQSNFHFIDDNQEWLQMDKMGHIYSAYQISRFGAELLQWGGATQKQQLLYGSGLGFVFQTSVELMDGFSSQWGFSVGDMIANTTGTALFVTQELLWKEQRIQPKFSFQTTHFPTYRPKVLGSNLSEQILKDYNGQTYWLSINLRSFYKQSKIPKWLNLALGYGATGMISGNGEIPDNYTGVFFQNERLFYLSLDLDLTKIDTKSQILKTFFTIFNSLKIPAPSIKFGAHKGLSGTLLQF